MTAYNPGYSTAQLLFLPESTSAIDRWSDRATRIVAIQFLLASGMSLAGWIWDGMDPRVQHIHYEHPQMPLQRAIPAVATILLPITSIFPRLLASYGSYRARRDLHTTSIANKIPIEPLYFCVFQLFQLIACSFLTSYDFIKFYPAGQTIFWLSLVTWPIPALTGFAYALTGVGRFCFAKPVQQSLRRYYATNEEYADNIEEHGMLELAYQQQQANEDISPAIPAALWREDNAQVISEARPQPCQSQDAGIPPGETSRQGCRAEQERRMPRQQVSSSETQNEQDTTTQPPSGNSPPQLRFSWQEASDSRNGGRQFWSPAIAASVLSMFCIRYTGYTLSYTYGITPEMRRRIQLTTIGPCSLSCLSLTFMIWPLRSPRFAVIFTTFCHASLTSTVWFVALVDSLVDFRAHLPYGLAFIALVMLFCHLLLLRCTMKMEWYPDYTSISKEIKTMMRGDPTS